MSNEEVQGIRASDLEDLQSRLALAALLARSSSDNSLELLILRRGHIKLRMRPEQRHGRAHFHIEYKAEYSASYAIDTLERLAGTMPRKYEKPILDWADDKQGSLRVTWDKLNAGEDVQEFVLERE